MMKKLLNRRTNHRLQVLTLLFLILGFILLFDINVKAGTTDFAGWTAISTAEELQKLSYSNESSKYYLTNDIDMSKYGYWNTISEFRGTLDGNGHCIKNLKSTTGGLFSNLYPGVIIRNLRLENVDILAESGTGAIAARATYDDCYDDWDYIDGLVAAGAYYTNIKGEQQIYIEPIKISKCIVSGKICAGDELCGVTAGLIGEDSGMGGYFSYGETSEDACYFVEGSLMIEECANFATICDVGGCVGGILGSQNSSSIVTNCANYGEISSSAKGGTVGGIVGSSCGRISNSYSTVDISPDESWGSIVGWTDKNAVINDCYYYGGNTGDIQSLFTPKKISRYDRSKKSSYSNWNFDSVWSVDTGINDGYPMLQWMLPYIEIEAPNANMKSGSYSKAFSVQLISHQSNATIHYTTDGSKPSTSSKMYTGAIFIDQTTTLKAIAVLANGAVSPIATFQYKFVCAQPTANYKSGKSFSEPAIIKLSTIEKGAKIYYTTNGKNPTKKSKVYKGAITLYKNTQIRAIVIKSGKASSEVISWNYYVKAKTPQANRPTGIYASALKVKLSCKTKGAKIYYTTNGKAPTQKSKQYRKTLTITKNTTLKMIAINKNVKSDVVTYYYRVKVENPVSNKTEGSYRDSVVVRLTCKTKNATIYYTIDGTEPSIYSKRYTGSIKLNQSTTIKAIAVKTGMDDSDVFTGNYYIYR